MHFKITFLCLSLGVTVVPAEQTWNNDNQSEERLKFIKASVDLDTDLSHVVSRLIGDVQRLQARVSFLEKLEDRVKELEERLGKQCRSCDVTSETERGGEHDKGLKEHKRDPGQGRSVDNTAIRTTQESPAAVAFSAIVSKPIEHIHKWQIIKFDRVILNTGNGYNSTSGVFTPPTSGTYLLLYHVGHYGEGETWVELMLNGGRVNGLALRGVTYNQDLQGSNSVVARLVAGDAVWVESYHVPDASVQDIFTTFSGVLIG